MIISQRGKIFMNILREHSTRRITESFEYVQMKCHFNYIEDFAHSFSIRNCIHIPNCASLSRPMRLKPAPFLLRMPHFSGFPMLVVVCLIVVSITSADFNMQQVSKKSGQGCRSGCGSSSAPILTSKMPSPLVMIEPEKE